MRCARRLLGSKAVSFVATDMDGSILSPSHVLSDVTKRTLQTLSQDRGVPLIFATGRQHPDVAVVVEHLKSAFQTAATAANKAVRETPLFLVCSNGATVHDAWSGRTVSTSALPVELVEELYTLMPRSETRVNTHVMQRSSWFCRMNWEEMLQFHQESGFAFQVLPRIPRTAEERERGKRTGDAPIRHGDASDVCQMSFTSWDRPLLEDLERHLQKTYADRLNITFSAAYCIDIAPKGVTKALGLQKVFRELAKRCEEDVDDVDAYVHACLSRTVSFGDDLNDAPMLKAVGHGHIMANCNPRLKEVCPDLPVIPSNAEDGPAKTLRKCFDLEDA